MRVLIRGERRASESMASSLPTPLGLFAGVERGGVGATSSAFRIAAQARLRRRIWDIPLAGSGSRGSPPDVRRRIEQLPAYLEAEGVLVAYLFGSLVEDDEPGREPRDVDLAVQVEEGAAWRLRDGLGKLLGTQRLDLVDLSRADPVLRFEIIRSGHPIYWRDDDTLNRFELDTMHLYRDTAPMRARQREYLRERTARWS